MKHETNISSDTNSHPGRPEELVPSRYAVKIGDIDVMVVSDGVITPPAEAMATNVEPAVRSIGRSVPPAR